MLKHSLPLHPLEKWTTLGIALVVAGFAWMAGSPAQATVLLTRADIEAILNRVEIIPQGRSARMARRSDVMAVGDTLRTAAQSQAQLRFNDGSLARVGERATFQFLPNTRNFRLSNGTVLLLIPPGRGRSTIQTPSAITGIQGSAVVVRHVESRNLTIVMALTNNAAGPMTVTTSGCGEAEAASNCGAEYSLYAGQMALVQNGQVQILEFDLPTFYDTSTLTVGLELNNPDSSVALGPDLNAVREETLDALSQASAFTDTVVLNPAALAVDADRPSVTPEPWLLSPARAETQVGDHPSILPSASSSLVGVPPMPPTAQPIMTQPSMAQPSMAQPPVAQPSVPDVPAAELPVAQPSVPELPVTGLPVTELPVTELPVTGLPVTELPVTGLPVTGLPVTGLPVTELPVTGLPVTELPVTGLPVTELPVTGLPVTELPVTEPPVVEQPSGPVVPASPPPFSSNPTVPANPPAEPPVIFQP
ncbi:MAG: hypothetical protein RLZZ597_2049 [Cyanobacteriota bacterium]